VGAGSGRAHHRHQSGQRALEALRDGTWTTARVVSWRPGGRAPTRCPPCARISRRKASGHSHRGPRGNAASHRSSQARRLTRASPWFRRPLGVHLAASSTKARSARSSIPRRAVACPSRNGSRSIPAPRWPAWPQPAPGSRLSSKATRRHSAGSREGGQHYPLYGLTPMIIPEPPVINPSLDAIQDSPVLQNTYDAEYGRSAGAQLNMVAQVGSRTMHGSGYDFSSATSALDAARRARHRRLPKPELHGTISAARSAAARAGPPAACRSSSSIKRRGGQSTGASRQRLAPVADCGPSARRGLLQRLRLTVRESLPGAFPSPATSSPHRDERLRRWLG